MEDKLIHKDLTYILRGLLFAVHNELGEFRNEKQYGDAFAQKLRDAGILFEREKVLPPSFVGEQSGRNRVDFLINNIIIIEIKHAPALSKNDYHQCQRYLVSLNLDLALLVNFHGKYLMVKRVLNYEKFKATK